jgi:hypothetical protein
MKSVILFLAALVVTTAIATAQGRKSYTVKPGEKIKDALPQQAVYLYPNFREGIVSFKNKTQGAAKLNYNKLVDEIEFIDNKGDTLALADEKNIAQVTIDNDTFYYGPGYVQKQYEFSHVKFGLKKCLLLSNREKEGAMGGVASSATVAYDQMFSRQGMKIFQAKEYLTFSEQTYYFIGDAYNRFKPMNKKNVLNMYAKKQSAVEAYFSEHTVNFVDEGNVKQLIAFLQTLQ